MQYDRLFNLQKDRMIEIKAYVIADKECFKNITSSYLCLNHCFWKTAKYIKTINSFFGGFGKFLLMKKPEEPPILGLKTAKAREITIKVGYPRPAPQSWLASYIVARLRGSLVPKQDGTDHLK